MRRHLVASVLGAALLVPTVAAVAHHSFAMFDSDQRTTLSGTVKEFQWTNPHAWLFVMVPNADGQLAQWAVEMQGPGQLMRQGWTPTSLTPGMNVTVDVHPLRDGTNGGQFVGITFPDGTQLGNPDRGNGPGRGRGNGARGGGDRGPVL